MSLPAPERRERESVEAKDGEQSTIMEFHVSGRPPVVGAIVALGTAVLAVGAMHPSSHQPMKFLCYLLVAVLASRLKVNLPGITGTMSVNFLFILLGILELSFAETLALGCAAILTQCFYRDRPNTVQVVVQHLRDCFRDCSGLFRVSRAGVQGRRTILRCCWWRRRPCISPRTRFR